MRWKKREKKELKNKTENEKIGLPIISVNKETVKRFLIVNWKQLIFLLVLTFICYFNSFNNAFISDDIPSITQNKEINQISYFASPILDFRRLTLFIIHKIFGFVPFWYRLSNILFHLGSGMVLYIIMYIFFNAPMALFISAIFIVHPIATESVTWISGGPYSNSGFFALLSLLFYMLSSRSKKYYILSFISFIIATFYSKQLVVFPLILLLFEFSFKTLKQNLLKLIPFFLVSVSYAPTLFGMIGVRISTLISRFYQIPGTENLFLKIPLAVTSYVNLVFWPSALTLYHSEPVTPLEYVIRVIGFILFLGFIVFLYKKEKRLFFWSVFYFIPLIPTLTPFKIAWVTAERYAYLSVIAVYLLFSYLIIIIGKKLKSPYFPWVIFFLVISALSFRTISRNFDWQNDDTMWVATARTSPSDPKTHNNMGDYYSRHGDLENAANEFSIAIKLNPGYGDAYHNLANNYYQMGKKDLAEENYKKAIFYNPGLWQSYQNLAQIYFEKNEFEKSLESIKKAIEINPNDPALNYNLGIIYMKFGRKGLARKALEKAIELNPKYEVAKKMLEGL